MKKIIFLFCFTALVTTSYNLSAQSLSLNGISGGSSPVLNVSFNNQNQIEVAPLVNANYIRVDWVLPGGDKYSETFSVSHDIPATFYLKSNEFTIGVEWFSLPTNFESDLGIPERGTQTLLYLVQY